MKRVMLAGDMRGARPPIRAFALLATMTVLAACGGSTPSPAPSSDVVRSTVAASETANDLPATEATASSTSTASASPARPHATIHIPTDAPTIQAAVDRSVPGDLLLIEPGIYREAVDVRTPGITLRGMDRNTVILDGGDDLENGVLVAADGVAIENLTVRRYTFNGVLFTKAYDDNVEDPTKHALLEGYLASYLTVSNNGQYGVYAFFARGGKMDHVYASGHPDSGVYVGQCKPCDAVLTDIVAEQNSIGYEGTNAGGSLFVINSIWRNNRIGLTPNSQNMERLAPQSDVVIAGNLIDSNNSAAAPATAAGAFGVGIAVAGGTRDRVLRNRVVGNAGAGVILTDLNGFQPEGNEVRGNVVERNGTDLVAVSSGRALTVAGGKNCFAENHFTTSNPASIESVLPCTTPVDGQVPVAAYVPVSPPPDVDYRSVALPGPQTSMPNAATAPATVVDGHVPTIDLATIVVPKAG